MQSLRKLKLLKHTQSRFPQKYISIIHITSLERNTTNVFILKAVQNMKYKMNNRKTILEFPKGQSEITIVNLKTSPCFRHAIRRTRLGNEVTYLRNNMKIFQDDLQEEITN